MTGRDDDLLEPELPPGDGVEGSDEPVGEETDEDGPGMEDFGLTPPG